MERILAHHQGRTSSLLRRRGRRGVPRWAPDRRELLGRGRRRRPTDEDRAAFAAAGVVLGRAALYVPKLLKPDVVTKRVAFAACTLAGASTPGTPRPTVRWPTGREVSIPASPAVLPELYAAAGYLPLGSLAVRADILERIVGRIARSEQPPDAGAVAGWLSCSRPAAERALERLAQLAA